MPFALSRVVTLAPALAVLGALTGCATPGSSDPAAARANGIAGDFARSRLVAADFVDVIAQLPALVPHETVLSAPAPDSRFGELLFAALQDAGYDMRIGAGGPALDWTIARDDDAGSARDGAGTYTFLVSAGGVKLKRDYAVDALGVRPVSTMLVHGADASAVVIDHARFERVAPAGAVASTGALRTLARSATAPERPATPSAAATAARAARAAGTTGMAGAAVAHAAPAAPRRASRVTTSRANLYETGRSAFAPILSGRAIVAKHVMVFADDSLVMGADNKRLARQLAARFDPATDLISLIGCSHGPSALIDGNRTLATGRAARVKEALVIAGIDPELVLDEGCWAATHFDRMPARGVVVTHRRR